MTENNPFLDEEREFGAGIEPEEAYETFLKAAANKVSAQTRSPDLNTALRRDAVDLSSFVQLDGRSHGNYEYPDILVSKTKLNLTHLISTHQYPRDNEIVERIFGIFKERSSKNISVAQKDYMTGLNWMEFSKLLTQWDYFMLTIRQFVDYVNLLSSGIVYDGKGIRLEWSEIDGIKNDIFARASNTERESKAEFLDARFNLISGRPRDSYIIYHKIQSNGELKEVAASLDESMLLKTSTILDPEYFNDATMRSAF